MVVEGGPWELRACQGEAGALAGLPFLCLEVGVVAVVRLPCLFLAVVEAVEAVLVGRLCLFLAVVGAGEAAPCQILVAVAVEQVVVPPSHLHIASLCLRTSVVRH